MQCAQVVLLISKCSESNGESVQLGVVRALLTVTTAEHFVLHGDCLMQVLDRATSLTLLPRRPGLTGLIYHAPRNLRTHVSALNFCSVSRLWCASQWLTYEHRSILQDMQNLQTPSLSIPSRQQSMTSQACVHRRCARCSTLPSAQTLRTCSARLAAPCCRCSTLLSSASLRPPRFAPGFLPSSPQHFNC